MTTRSDLHHPTRGCHHHTPGDPDTPCDPLDERLAAAAERLEHDDITPPDQWDVLFATIHLVRRDGPDAATRRLVAALERHGHPATGTRRRGHATLTAFTVWAVDRLLGAGLDATAVLWHPLSRPEAARGWYRPETLASDLAHRQVVAADLALPGDPQPGVRRTIEHEGVTA